MRNILLTIFLFFSILHSSIFAQGNSCANASPFCTAAGAATFPASQNTTAPSGPNYGCLFSQPNPAWFYLQIATAGPITLTMSNSANVDIDFVMWGPFTSPTAACASGLTGATVACSYSANSVETGTIASASVGEVYVLMVTNYSNQPTTISVAQTGGTGATNCGIVCSIDTVIYVQGACQSPANTYTASGFIKYHAPPSSGTLTISNSCSSINQVINSPFPADSVAYSLVGMPADGANCTITAVFSADANCTKTLSITNPPPCFVVCPFTVDSVKTCNGVAAQLTASGANHYVWSTGDTTATILISGVQATYTVIGITGTCSDTMTTHVTTFPPPTASFTADTLVGCSNFTTHFVADTTGNFGATYSWNYGESGPSGTGDSTSHHYSVAGCHDVILTASFGVGCSTSDTMVCMINVYPNPIVNFNVAPDGLDAIASTAYFSNTSTNAISWLWNFGDSITSILQNPEHTFANVGVYDVKLYATSSNGCIDSTMKPVTVSDIITHYVPTAFTPNRNDLNEVFNIYSYGILPDNFEMLIFDRWGKQVFRTTDLYEGWNGSVNNTGPAVQSDVYVYRINYKEINGKRKSLDGIISVLH